VRGATLELDVESASDQRQLRSFHVFSRDQLPSSGDVPGIDVAGSSLSQTSLANSTYAANKDERSIRSAARTHCRSIRRNVAAAPSRSDPAIMAGGGMLTPAMLTAAAPGEAR
jgi:hypothetical protein